MRRGALYCVMQVIPCMLVLCWNCMAFAQNEYPAEMLAAAQQRLPRLLTKPIRDFLVEGGYIEPCTAISAVTLGEPYLHYRLDKDRVLLLDDIDSFKTCLAPMAWDIPVYVNGKSATLITMDYANAKWELGGIGGDPTPFLEARALWPASEGYRVSYVKDAGGLDYFMIEKGNDIGLYSFRDGTEKTLGITRDSSGQFPLLSVQYVVEKLKAQRRPSFNPKLE